MTRLSVSRIAADVQSGKTSALAIAAAALVARKAYDAIQPHAWITQASEESVLGQARAVDALIKAGAKPPLAGVPFAVKDNIDVEGLPTTAAYPAFSHMPEATATTVRLLQEAGAICLGKTNLDQFATGLNGTRSPYGAPSCVFNHDFISGGSSSGSSVTVAAGVVAFALGTDTAGSGRVPAAINHLIGFKPTKGRWSTSGLLPACRSLDCITVFANDVEDAALVDSVLARFDAEDDYSRRAPQTAPIAKPRIGFAALDALEFHGDAESRALYMKAAAHLLKLAPGGKPVETAPLIECAKLLYEGPWVAERTAALAPLLKSNPSAIHPVVRAIVEKGLSFSAVDTFEGLYDLQAYLRFAEQLWNEIDILVLPTAPTIFTHAEMRADPIGANSKLGLYTNFVNLLDMSAIALPAGFRENGTGFGITLIGPAWAEETLFALAKQYQQTTAFEAPPLDQTPPLQGVKLAVVGAHLHGMPLHHQLESRNARFIRAAQTAPTYKLYAMQTTPPKPALVHDETGASLALEIYELSHAAFGEFTEEVPAPLAIGTVILEDGSSVKGFVAEPRAMADAKDVTSFGGWRAYIASLKR